METFLLQPWTTILGNATSITKIVQEEEGWIDLADAADAVFWVDVRAVTTAASGTSVFLMIESSPTKDEAFFWPVALGTLAPTQGSMVLKTVHGMAPVAGFPAPLGRWARWLLITNSTTAGTWGATFRIRASRARTPFFTPSSAPGCKLWLRADQGITYASTTSASVASWADATGNAGNTLSQATSQTQPTYVSNQFNGCPAISFNSANTQYLGTSSGVTVSAGNSLVVVAQSTSSMPVTNATFFGSPSTVGAYLAQTSAGSSSLTLINTGGTATQSVANPLTNTNIIQVDWGSSTSAVYQNGALQGTVSTGGAVTVNSVGATPSNIAGYVDPLNGSIAEVLLFYPTLTPSWRTLVTRYLGNRYGITVL